MRKATQYLNKPINLIVNKQKMSNDYATSLCNCLRKQ